MKPKDINSADIDRFLAGELSEESPLYDQIVHDFVNNDNGQVMRYLQTLVDARKKELSGVYDIVMDNDPYKLN
ncbi:hypothetical protein A2706_01930 [Candidatus Peribacteria bacterium RIFCSPHIGHO2_01_FULL_51_35]|nr:MAG: hypothetical protein A2706_01930 [Candidatus Peribacteria bacterium RIFCSPHIGHO2_01_FULL_51_35]